MLKEVAQEKEGKVHVTKQLEIKWKECVRDDGSTNIERYEMKIGNEMVLLAFRTKKKKNGKETKFKRYRATNQKKNIIPRITTLFDCVAAVGCFDCCFHVYSRLAT